MTAKRAIRAAADQVVPRKLPRSAALSRRGDQEGRVAMSHLRGAYPDAVDRAVNAIRSHQLNSKTANRLLDATAEALVRDADHEEQELLEAMLRRGLRYELARVRQAVAQQLARALDAQGRSAISLTTAQFRHLARRLMRVGTESFINRPSAWRP